MNNLLTKEQEEEIKQALKGYENHIFICQKCKKEMKHKDIGDHAKENHHYEYKSKITGCNLGLLIA